MIWTRPLYSSTRPLTRTALPARASRPGKSARRRSGTRTSNPPPGGLRTMNGFLLSTVRAGHSDRRQAAERPAASAGATGGGSALRQSPLSGPPGLGLGGFEPLHELRIERERPEPRGEALPEDELVEKGPVLRGQEGQQASVLVFALPIVGQPDLAAVKLQESEPLGHVGHETHVLALVGQLRGIDADETDLALAAVLEPDLDRVAVVDEDDDGRVGRKRGLAVPRGERGRRDGKGEGQRENGRPLPRAREAVLSPTA